MTVFLFVLRILKNKAVFKLLTITEIHLEFTLEGVRDTKIFPKGQFSLVKEVK